MHFYNSRNVVLLACSIFSFSLKAEYKMAFIGDVFTTGYLADPKYQDKIWGIWDDIFLGKPTASSKIEDIESLLGEKMALNDRPIPLAPITGREFNSPIAYVMQNFFKTLQDAFVDQNQFSWPHLVALRGNVLESETVIASEREAKVDFMPRLVDRVLDVTKGELPGKVFVFFSFADLCAIQSSLVTNSVSYGDSLIAGLKYLIKNSKSSGPSKIYILDYLNISQFISNENILEKKIELYPNASTTCKKARENSFQVDMALAQNHSTPQMFYLSQLIPQNPVTSCPTVFGMVNLAKMEVGFFKTQNEQEKFIKESQENQLVELANRVRNYRAVTKEAINSINEWLALSQNKRNITIEHVGETAQIIFDDKDVAGNCHFLSFSGHAKIAKAVFSKNN